MPSGFSGIGVAAVHQVAGVFQQRAEFAARMQHAEVDRGEATALQQRDGERVAQRELHQRGRRRREIVRASLPRLRQHQRDIGGGAQRGVALGGHGDQGDTKALGIGDEVLHLRLSRRTTTAP